MRAWVRQAGIDTGHGPAGSLTTEEREELGRLRREVRTLRMEVPEVGEAVEQIGQRNEVVAHLAIDPRRMDRVELGLGAVSGVHAG